MVAAYSYMALVPIVQPPVIRALTTKARTDDPYAVPPAHGQQAHEASYSRSSSPPSAASSRREAVALVGFLMFGNLIRVCGVLDSLSETAQKTLSNLITLFLGLTIAVRMQAAIVF